MKWRPAAMLLDVHRGATLDQHADDLRGVRGGGAVQRRHFHRIHGNGGNVGAAPDEFARDGGLVEEAGEVKRGESVARIGFRLRGFSIENFGNSLGSSRSRGLENVELRAGAQDEVGNVLTPAI